MTLPAPRIGMLSVTGARGFVILIGVTSLFGDMSYQAGRSLHGQYLHILGASAAAVGVAAGAGELLAYALRLVTGLIADRTGQYWALTLVGYAINLLAVPAMAFAGRWEVAVGLIFAERIGKAIRNPSRDAMLSYAANELGRGWGFGLHEALDRVGSLSGPLVVTAVLVAAGGTQLGLGAYQAGYLLLAAPALLALAMLLTARFFFPRPADLESETPEITASGYGREYWWYVAAVGMVAAGFADFPLMAYHFKETALTEDRWIPLFYGGSLALAGATGLIGGRLYDELGPKIVPAVFAIGTLFAPFVFLGGSLPLVLVGSALWGVGIGAQESIMKAVVGDLVPASRRAAGYGMYHTVFGVCWFLGSALMGFLYDRSVVYLVIFSVAIQLLALPVFLAPATGRGRPRMHGTGERRERSSS